MRKIFNRILMYSLYGLILQLLVCSMLLAASPTHAQQAKSTRQVILNLRLQQDGLTEVFKKIEANTDFLFVYNLEDINTDIRLSQNFESTSLYDILVSLSRSTGLGFKRVNSNITVKKLNHNKRWSVVEEQVSIQVEGKVTAVVSGESIPGVNVIVKGTGMGTVTDVNGYYSIKVPSAYDTLVFSSIGYLTEEIAVNGRSTIEVSLAEDIKSLEEIVVVGYGTIKKKDLTGAVGVITSQDVDNQAVPSVAQALQGRIAGLNIRQTDGGPGSNAEIVIRGRGTFGANASPLVVIDGIITNGGLTDIDPNNIEDVTVLKDASSAAIYGSRGANGVVLITTKRGKAGKEVINFQTYYSVDNVINKINTVDATTYASMVNDFYVNQGKEAPYENTQSLGRGTNWQDEIFRTGSKQNYSLSLSGGTDKNTHAISLSYYKGEGIVVNSKYSRANFRVNNDIKPLKGLKLGSGIGLSYGVSAEGSPQEAINRALIYAPNVKPYNDNGSYGIADMAGQPTTMSQPLVAAYERVNDTERTRLLSNLYAEYEIVPSLKFRTSVGIEYSKLDGKNFVPSYNFGLGNVNGIATLNRSLNTTKNYILDNILTYSKTISQAHHVNLMMGYTFQSEKYEYVSAYRDTYSRNDDYMQVLDAGTANDRARGGYTEWAIQSYLSRLNYSFRDTYMLSSSIRIDESSRFAPDKRTGVFPSFSAGWVLSNESFLQGILGPLSYLKLRAGYGVLGNQEIGVYPYQALINSNLSYSFGSSQNIFAGAAPTGLANQNISWEKTTTTGVGLEVNFFDDKLNLIADYYNRHTSDVLVSVPLPNISGLASSPYQNVGSVSNRGFEFTLNYRNTNIERDFSYNLGINLTINDNKVTKLDQGLDIIQAGGGQGGVEYRTTQGQAINSFYGYVHDGIFQSDEDVRNSSYQPNAEPGDIKFKDLNDDGVIDDNDRTYLGNTMAKQIVGFNSSVRYKNIDLFINITGDFGRSQSIYAPGFAVARAAEATSQIWARRWVGEGSSNYVPRIVGGDPNGNSRSSDFWICSQDYLRVQNIQLGYDFSTKLTERVNIRKLRLYLAAQNLLTLTDFPGFDPETSTTAYPISRSVFVGLNLGL